MVLDFLADFSLVTKLNSIVQMQNFAALKRTMKPVNLISCMKHGENNEALNLMTQLMDD